MRAWQAPASQLQPCEHRVALNLHHDAELEVGEVTMLARDRGGVWAVAVAEGVDSLLEFDEPIFYSIEGVQLGTGELLLEGAALTTAPAALSLRPVSLFRGDPRQARSEVVYQHGYPGELVKRAADQTRMRKRGAPPIDDRPFSAGPDDFPFDTLSPAQRRELQRSRRLPNGLLKSAHRGRVLSVR